MNNSKSILIAVELDKASEVVLEYGITLGLMLDATVHCLHVSRPAANRIIYNEAGDVIDDFSGESGHVNYPTIEDLEEKDLKELRGMVLSVIAKLGVDDYGIRASVRSDFAVSGILSEASDIGADLIIVGSHVDYRNKEIGVTNLSKQVISQSSKSVIVVPTSYGNRNLDHIAVFINFTFSELAMMQDGIDLAIDNKVHLTFVHILSENESVSDVEKKLDILRRIFLQNEEHELISFISQQGELTTIIDNLTNDLDVDLIGLKPEKKNWNLFGFQKSFGSKVMEHLNVPIYIWK